MNKLNLDVDSIYAVGDIHGYFNSLLFFIKSKNITNSAIIVCGDCGIGYRKWDAEKNIQKHFNDLLIKQNVYVVLFRGNHDDPSFFTGNELCSNIILIEDYTVVNNNILCVGGAISIDRQYRLKIMGKLRADYLTYHPHKTYEDAIENTTMVYWDDEPPVYNETALSELKENGINITTVCTHTCPSFCYPLTKDGIKPWIEQDPDLDKDIDDERNVMTKLYDKLISDGHNIKEWIYGHYHTHKNEIIDNVNYILLDAVVQEGGLVDIYEIKN